MKFSIITPTHKTEYLLDLYKTLTTQTYGNWEWIIYLNGNASEQDLHSSILEDTRVVVYEDTPTEQSSNVGYLKNRAFHLGTGDILVEMDHDDVLVPTCLEELAKAYIENPDVGFVFSDDFKITDSFTPYGKKWGWTDPYTVEWEGTEYLAMNSFDANAQSLSLIYYSPDHVRTWRRDIYVELGGHDPELSILDDQDLITRTYLKTKFYHINKALYGYRIYGENTWLERNKAIQVNTYKIGRKYYPALCKRDAELRDLDVVSLRYTDIDFDINGSWPIQDSSVGYLDLKYFVEYGEDILHIMSEIYRVLADRGTVFIEVPSTDGRGAFQNPLHKSFWNENTFGYFSKKSIAGTGGNSHIRFQESFTSTYFPTSYYKEKNIPVTETMLTAIKGNSRRSGIQNI